MKLNKEEIHTLLEALKYLIETENNNFHARLCGIKTDHSILIKKLKREYNEC